MQVCFDSNCFSALIDKATSEIYGIDKTKPIKYAKERMEYFIKSERPRILVPTPIYTETLLISSIDKNVFDEFLEENSKNIDKELYQDMESLQRLIIDAEYRVSDKYFEGYLNLLQNKFEVHDEKMTKHEISIMNMIKIFLI